MEFNYNDGGCGEAGYETKINTGDCLVRSLAIANYYKYEWAWNVVEICCQERRNDNTSGPGKGVELSLAESILQSCGWSRTTYKGISMEGLPRPQDWNEMVILEFPEHVSVMKYGVLNDRHKCRGMKLRAVWYRSK